MLKDLHDLEVVMGHLVLPALLLQEQEDLFLEEQVDHPKMLVPLEHLDLVEGAGLDQEGQVDLP